MTDDITLVVGDAHIDASQNTAKKLERFTWLGKHIQATKPSRVVFIGDALTLESLSAWDKGKRLLQEGHRYHKDIAAGKQAFDMMFDQISKPVLRNIEWVYLKGNHEDRLDRYLQIEPVFEGHVDVIKDLGLDKDLWKIVPYKENYKYKGVNFTHIPITEGGTGVSASGASSVAKKALDLYGTSVVFGHTHKLEVACKHRHGDAHLQQALNVGCFFEHVDAYAKGSTTSYWRGLVELDHYAPNRFDVNTISLGKLKRIYQ
jgi:predicted phosphodiesterase